LRDRPLVGLDYDSAVISGAFCGFAMGATLTAIANEQASTRRPSPLSSCASSARFFYLINLSVLTFCGRGLSLADKRS
jgi:glutamate:Na+ symporter, ESS family